MSTHKKTLFDRYNLPNFALVSFNPNRTNKTMKLTIENEFKIV